MPAIGLFSAHRGPHTDAVAETDAGAVTCADARTDARTDDGDARAHTGTVRVTHTCSIAKTDDGSALSQADAVALLVCLMLERQEYGSYRLR